MDITIDQILTEFSKDLLNIILFNMDKPYVAQNGKTYKGLRDSDLYKSLKVEVSDSSDIDISVIANEYFINVDAGRRAGARKPPYLAILKWLKKKGIRARNKKGQFASMTLNTLAYIIRNSIAKKGIKARNIIKNSLIGIDKLYKEEVEGGISDILQTLMNNISINFNNNALYKDKGLFTIRKHKQTIKK